MEPVAELRTHMQQFEQMLRAKGYDQVSIDRFSITPNSVAINYAARDTFQDGLPSEYQCSHGPYQYIWEPTIGELYSAIQRIPSRSQREVRCLIWQTSALGAKMEELQNEEVRLFVQTILDDVSELHNLLEASARD